MLYNRLSLVVSIVLTLVVVGYLGWVYSMVRTIDQWKLAHMALLSHNRTAAYIADFEVNRRIRNGSENGVDTLILILDYADSEFVDRKLVFEKVEQLLNIGTDINSYSSLGETALHNAIGKNQPNATEFLLRHCADASMPTSFEPDPAQQRNAIELAFWYDGLYLSENYDSVIKLLESRQLTSHCSDRPF